MGALPFMPGGHAIRRVKFKPLEMLSFGNYPEANDRIQMKRAKGRLAGIAIALWCCTLAEAQISPGPLSRAHQQLEGVTKCASCHDFGAGSRGFRCLECHAEIRRRVDAH